MADDETIEPFVAGDLSKLTNAEFEQKQQEFIRYRKQVARSNAAARTATMREEGAARLKAEAMPKPVIPLSEMTDAQFDKAQKEFIRTVSRRKNG